MILPNLWRTLKPSRAEIDQRIWATNRAWRDLYGIVVEQEGAIQDHRTLFRGAVCGASLTGLTALLLHDRDYLRLQKCLEKKLRALMLGTASWEGPDHNKDPQLSPSVEKVAAGAACTRALCTKAQMVPEHCPESPHVMHIFHAVSLAECTSNRTTHSLRAFACILRQMVMQSDYWQTCRRWAFRP